MGSNSTLVSKTVTKQGKTYWEITDFLLTLDAEKVEYQFNDLFDGDELMGKQINLVLNDNWDKVFSDIKTSYSKSFGLVYKDLANRVFGQVALEDIFLE